MFSFSSWVPGRVQHIAAGAWKKYCTFHPQINYEMCLMDIWSQILYKNAFMSLREKPQQSSSIFSVSGKGRIKGDTWGEVGAQTSPLRAWSHTQLPLQAKQAAGLWLIWTTVPLHNKNLQLIGSSEQSLSKKCWAQLLLQQDIDSSPATLCPTTFC